ncbi:hypothetical protein N0V86_001412 [Didymella sp. IMI 355093]|nr:hypothetical protein N0V86_001412 [Didymella sp. IMI 355093]
MKVVLLASALMSLFTTTLAGSGGQTCKEEALKCGGGNPGGAVFVCRKGRWEVLIDCGASESCITDPVPTCTWTKAFAEDAVGVTTGFEISSELVAADVKKKEAAASSAPANDKNDDAAKVQTADDSPYYNICSPCIRHNDYCKATECDWQDLVANSPKCTPFNKFGGSSVGTYVNLNCRICMFFRDSVYKNLDLSWSGPSSPYFSAAIFNSYFCSN